MFVTNECLQLPPREAWSLQALFKMVLRIKKILFVVGMQRHCSSGHDQDLRILWCSKLYIVLPYGFKLLHIEFLRKS